MSTTASINLTTKPGRWKRFLDGDLWFSFTHSPTAIIAAVIAVVCVTCAVFAGWIAPHNPFDLATLDLTDARLPPAWVEGGTTKYLFGTDDQGRDILSALMYGSRISLLVGLASVALSVLIGVAPMRVMFRHVLPNVLGPVLVLATIQIAGAIIIEATLSFLGVGVPPTAPSLGTLIRIGQDFLFTGEWWITVFPGMMLVLIALSVNLLGDWLRDVLNPKLR